MLSVYTRQGEVGWGGVGVGVIISRKIKGTEHYVVEEDGTEVSVGAHEGTNTCALLLFLNTFSLTDLGSLALSHSLQHGSY